MCGIAGYINHNPQLRITDERIKKAIRYRGRDWEAEWSDGEGVRLFHSRLAILDIEYGAQPMADVSGRYVIVFNGEIYNHSELRRQFIQGGAKFRTNSDTEVVLEGYRLLGDRVLSLLNGMYAFAIWDCVNKVMFLARDHLGKKPLFYFFDGNSFFFSSTLDAFYATPGWTGELSQASISFYATLGSYPLSGSCYSLGRSIPPGHFAKLHWSKSDVSLHRYWQLKFSNKFPGSYESLMCDYADILTDAVRLRLEADVPVAATFSGGVDSGTIVSIAKLFLNSDLPVFTIDYNSDEFPSEETEVAEKVAKHLGLNWEYIHYDYSADLMDELCGSYENYDQPCSRVNLVYASRLYSVLKKSATVVISGNGADELFAGYNGNEDNFVRDLKRSQTSGLFSSILMRISAHFNKNNSVRKMAEVAQSQRDYIIAHAPSHLREEIEFEADNIVKDMLETELSSFMDLSMYMSLYYSSADSVFRVADISGLGEQVEVRSPFFDRRMVDFAARLPHNLKIGSAKDPTFNKFLPKKYYEKFVPHEFAWASKKGFAANIRFDHVFANKEHTQRFENAFDAIDRSGLCANIFRDGYRLFIDQMKCGVSPVTSLSVSTRGLMLGEWILARRERVL